MQLKKFLAFLPSFFLNNVVIPQTNANLNVTMNQQLTMLEFFKFLDCIFFTACFKGISDQQNWWSSKPIDALRGAPFQLNEYMLSHRFKYIMQALQNTNEPLSNYTVHFHDVGR